MQAAGDSPGRGPRVDVGGERMPACTAPARMAARISGMPPSEIIVTSLGLTPNCSSAARTARSLAEPMRVMPIFLPLSSAPLAMLRLGEQRENHLMGRGADPDEVGALNPSGQHRRRRQMAELNLAGEQRLHRGGTAANVNQIRVQAMFAKMTCLRG